MTQKIFFSCLNSYIIVSGDNDLPVIKKYEHIQIMIAKDFYEKYLVDPT